jgi:hypothetical protein
VILELDDFMCVTGIVEAPHANALFVNGSAITGGRVHYLYDVLIFEQGLEAALKQKLLVPTDPEEVDLTGAGFQLNQA